MISRAFQDKQKERRKKHSSIEKKLEEQSKTRIKKKI